MKVINANDITISCVCKSIKIRFNDILVDAEKYGWSRAEITSEASCMLFNYAAAHDVIKRSAIIDVYEDNILAKIYFTGTMRLVGCTRLRSK